MRAEQLMTRIVHACGPDDRLNEAAQIMWERDLGCVPVVDSDRKVVGMLTDRDISMAAYTQGRLLSEIRVGDVMSRRIHVCGPDEELELVEERMRAFRVRRLPVTDGKGTLLGLISLNDLALEAAREANAGRAHIRFDGVGLTLATICQHRGAKPVVSAPRDDEYELARV